jgi:nitrite reductase/ring-hydroxylating ferredoxin subunit
MDLPLQNQLFEEIRGYMAANATRLAPEDMHHRALAYYGAEHFAREQALLRRQPLVVGHSGALARPGDCLAHDDAGAPIAMIRQEDGGLKAFLNICRHRGARPCPAGASHRPMMVCPYHAWTYALDGRLTSVPAQAFPSVDLGAHGLVELPCEERHGLIWVVPTPGAAIDVARHLGPLDGELASFGMGDLVLERDTVLAASINWKFVLDGFLEVYHIPKLHAGSIAPWIFGKYSPFDAFGRHGRLVGVRKSFRGIRDAEFDSASFLAHVAVNYQIFPNTIAVWQGDHFEIWTAYPGATPGGCVVRVQSLVTRAMAGDAHRSRWDRNWKVLIDTVVAEDWPMSEQVQRSLPFAPGGQVVFGRNEPGLQHFHRALDEAAGHIG